VMECAGKSEDEIRTWIIERLKVFLHSIEVN